MHLKLHPKRPEYSRKVIRRDTQEVRCYNDAGELVYHKVPPDFAASYCKGQLHSVRDRPALFSQWVASWYTHGVLDRPGDAFARVDAKRQVFEYFCNGLRHRDGNKPAVVDVQCGVLQWWVCGVLVYESTAAHDEIVKYISYD
jgi:hypothetical protein